MPQIDRRHDPFGLIDLANEQVKAHGEESGVKRVGVIVMRRQYPRRGFETVLCLLEITRRERDLGLCDHTAGPGNTFACAEAPRGTPQEVARTTVIAELGHRDAAKRECRGIVAQGYAVECAEGIASGERACCRRNQ